MPNDLFDGVWHKGVLFGTMVQKFSSPILQPPRESNASVGKIVFFVTKHDESASDFTLTFCTSWKSIAQLTNLSLFKTDHM